MMKIQNYIKEKRADKRAVPDILMNVAKRIVSFLLCKKKPVLCAAFVLTGIFLIAFLCVNNSHKVIFTSQEGIIQTLDSPIAAAAGKRSVISVPSGIVKANPFLPYRDIDSDGKVVDVPAFELVEPPEMVSEDSDAARVMDTIVSGILYDKFSPSAILNIEGNDYLVKKGDVVNNYKVLNIMQDSVTVKLGANVYKAGIGEILTEGTLNHNNVSNLSSKFGGER